MNGMWREFSKNDQDKTDSLLLKRFAYNKPLHRQRVVPIMAASQHSRSQF